MTDLLYLYIFMLAAFTGYEVISRVPVILHTPLMSMTNAISAVTLLGALLLFSVAGGVGSRLIGAVAIIAATFNVVGGFAITDRMLRMFRTKEKV